MSKLLQVGHLLGRKRPALWMMKDGGFRALAYFANEAAMEEFLKFVPVLKTNSLMIEEDDD